MSWLPEHGWWPVMPWCLPVAVTRRILRFYPMPDITTRELSLIVASLGSFNVETDLAYEDLVSCIPDGCHRHFTCVEILYERRGDRMTVIGSYLRIIFVTVETQVTDYKFTPVYPGDWTRGRTDDA